MPSPYAWNKLAKSNTSGSVSARAGHSFTASKSGIVCFGGIDGRKNEKGLTVPNNDLHILKLRGSMAPQTFAPTICR